jgi:hypothetical protein
MWRTKNPPDRGRRSPTTLNEEGWMNEPEVRSKTEVPPEERVEGGDERNERQRGAPIDEDVAGELNAALPEEPLDEDETDDGRR